jgi:hypothetical protein
MAPSKGGRPCIADSDLLFAAVMKIYFGRSASNMPGFLRQAQGDGLIRSIPKASTLLNFFAAERSTGLLQRLLNRTCRVLKPVEGNVFAVDSTTFRLSRFERWYDKKRHDAVEEKELVKAHMICGIETHVVAQVVVTGGYEADQGQRPLRGFSGKDLEQELVIPGAATTLANQAVAGGVLLQKG